jgi:hypothetical protein
MPLIIDPISTGSNLVTDARAQQNSILAALYASNAAYAASLVAAGSTAVRKYCHRYFTLATFTQYLSGGNYVKEPLSLREFPVTQITRIAANPTAALRVTNTGATAQRATVATTATGLTLTAVESGVTFADTLLYTAYPTLGALAAAVSAAGHGFGCQVQSAATINLSLYPSVDLRPLQGAMNCLGGGAYLEAWLEDVQGWGDGWGGYGWRLDPDTGQLYAHFPRGHLNIRADYQAGYAVIPAEVQEAAVQWALYLYQLGSKDLATSSASLGPFSYSLSTKIPTHITALLSRYVAYDKVISYS